jgi:carboxypeptidase family protein
MTYRSLLILIIPIILILACSKSTDPVSEAEITLTGQVTKYKTDIPLQGVEISLLIDPEVKVTSDDSGSFNFRTPLAPGQYDLRFEKENYSTIRTSVTIFGDDKSSNVSGGLQGLASVPTSVDIALYELSGIIRGIVEGGYQYPSGGWDPPVFGFRLILDYSDSRQLGQSNFSIEPVLWETSTRGNDGYFSFYNVPLTDSVTMKLESEFFYDTCIVGFDTIMDFDNDDPIILTPSTCIVEKLCFLGLDSIKIDTISSGYLKVSTEIGSGNCVGLSIIDPWNSYFYNENWWGLIYTDIIGDQITIEFNPEYPSNNVILEGTIADGLITGTWRRISAGVQVNHGFFSTEIYEGFDCY